MAENVKCTRCKRDLSMEVFFYNGKIHKTCFYCSDSRKSTKNKCQTCSIKAIYNYEGQENGIFCKKHSKAGMVNIKHHKCITCKIKYPGFNYPCESKALYCKDCSLSDMINVKSPRCIGCKIKQPAFNYHGESKALYCKGCSLFDMINVINPKCIGCKIKQPAFNYHGESKALYCKGCSLFDMINVINPNCISCKIKQPVFNYHGESKALYCKDCSLPNMINVKSPKCIGCKIKQPAFNYHGESKALYCKGCSLFDMINVINPKCISCKIKRPAFNYHGESKALYCKGCSLSDMINVKSPNCISCKIKQPAFNYHDESKALYCKDCSLPNMINVKSPKCITCNKCASYGIPCNRPNKCTLHKEDGMIKNPTAHCRKKNCNNTAIYGSKAPLHCELHKTSDDVLLVERQCKQCGILDVLLNNLCINFCCMDEKSKQIKKYQKVKEKRILKVVSSEFKVPTEYNLRIPYVCGKKHSEEKEIGYDFITHKTFIEVDENQHKSYCEIGEKNRMINIYMAEGGIPIVFIRYNPDNYMISGKKCKISQANREVQLIKWLEHYEIFENIQHPLTVHYLYYDDKLSEISYIDPY